MAFQIKRNQSSNPKPAPSLKPGELAVDIPDKKLYVGGASTSSPLVFSTGGGGSGVNPTNLPDYNGINRTSITGDMNVELSAPTEQSLINLNITDNSNLVATTNINWKFFTTSYFSSFSTSYYKISDTVWCIPMIGVYEFTDAGHTFAAFEAGRSFQAGPGLETFRVRGPHPLYLNIQGSLQVAVRSHTGSDTSTSRIENINLEVMEMPDAGVETFESGVYTNLSTVNKVMTRTSMIAITSAESAGTSYDFSGVISIVTFNVNRLIRFVPGVDYAFVFRTSKPSGSGYEWSDRKFNVLTGGLSTRLCYHNGAQDGKL